uniref:Uncharacterized protein n=1 Tax=Rousettus aegyptiacus TaxID=9407 RepID=A0A7J8B9H2_ROUAE|nr:hypothetical protein HJG63_010009 [Rousettus aegyptiacus]
MLMASPFLEPTPVGTATCSCLSARPSGCISQATASSCLFSDAASRGSSSVSAEHLLGTVPPDTPSPRPTTASFYPAPCPGGPCGASGVPLPSVFTTYLPRGGQRPAGKEKEVIRRLPGSLPRGHEPAEAKLC